MLDDLPCKASHNVNYWL